MNRRATFLLTAIWPEIAIYPLVVCLGSLCSDIVFNASTFFASDVKWFWSAVVVVPICVAGLSYSKADDLLNPKGKRVVLLEWPDYRLFKDLAVAACVLFVVAQVIALTGFYLVAVSKRPFGLILIVASLLQTAFTFATLVLANWKSREILRE